MSSSAVRRETPRYRRQASLHALILVEDGDTDLSRHGNLPAIITHGPFATVLERHCIHQFAAVPMIVRAAHTPEQGLLQRIHLLLARQ